MEIDKEPYNSIPVVTITTRNHEKIHVFKVANKDAWSICDFVVANEDRLQDFFPETREQNLTPDLSKRFATIKAHEFEKKKEFLYTLKLDASNKVIGLVYIKELNWEIKQGEFAYAIDYNWERKGVTSRVVEKLSKHAFGELRLETLQIIVHKSNIGSTKVAQKNGFQWVKTLLKAFTPRGKEAMDMELYELYKE